MGSDLSVLTTQTKQALYNLLDRLDTADYTDLAAAEDDFLLAQNRLQVSTGQSGGYDAALQTLQAEYDEIYAQLSALQTITAETNGYFRQRDGGPGHHDRPGGAGRRIAGRAAADAGGRVPGGGRRPRRQIATGFS